MTEFGIQYQPISDTIAIGRLNKKRSLFLEKVDVTNAAISSVMDYLLKQQSMAVSFIEEDGTRLDLVLSKTERGDHD